MCMLFFRAQFILHTTHRGTHLRIGWLGKKRLVEISPQTPSLVVCRHSPRCRQPALANRPPRRCSISRVFYALLLGQDNIPTCDGLPSLFLHTSREKTRTSDVVVRKTSWPRLHPHLGRRIARCFFCTVLIVKRKPAWIFFSCTGVCGILRVLHDTPCMSPFGGGVPNSWGFFVVAVADQLLRSLSTLPPAISLSYPNGGNDRHRRCFAKLNVLRTRKMTPTIIFPVHEVFHGFLVVDRGELRSG